MHEGRASLVCRVDDHASNDRVGRLCHPRSLRHRLEKGGWRPVRTIGYLRWHRRTAMGKTTDASVALPPPAPTGDNKKARLLQRCKAVRCNGATMFVARASARCDGVCCMKLVTGEHAGPEAQAGQRARARQSCVGCIFCSAKDKKLTNTFDLFDSGFTVEANTKGSALIMCAVTTRASLRCWLTSVECAAEFRVTRHSRRIVFI